MGVVFRKRRQILQQCAGWSVLANARPVSPLASYLKGHQVTKCPGSWLGPPSSGSLSSGDAPWARAERTSMSWQRSRGIPAARPTPHHLRSACTQVAMCVVWTVAHEDQKPKQGPEACALFCSSPACRRQRFQRRHRRQAGLLQGFCVQFGIGSTSAHIPLIKPLSRQILVLGLEHDVEPIQKLQRIPVRPVIPHPVTV